MASASSYSFNNADAPSVRTEQYYEQLGNRAMYKDGWKAVTIHGNRMPWITGRHLRLRDGQVGVV